MITEYIISYYYNNILCIYVLYYNHSFNIFILSFVYYCISSLDVVTFLYHSVAEQNSTCNVLYVMLSIMLIVM